MTDRTSRLLAVAGVGAGVAGVAMAHATVWALRTSNGPIVAVASAVRDFTPGRLAHWLIGIVGTWDKPLLLAGTTIILLALCAGLGVLARRWPLVPDLGFTALAALGLICVLRLSDSTITSALAVIVGLVSWIVAFRFLSAPVLARAAAGADDTAPSPATGHTRRVFAQRVGIVAVLVGLAAVGGRVASRSRRKVERARELLRLPVTRGRAPDGAHVDVDGVVPWRTPNGRFYLIHTVLAAPSIEPMEWQLRVHGMVDRELTVSYKDLVERDLAEAWITLCCVSNEVGGDLIGNAWWSGVPVRTLLAEAGVQAGADAVLQTSHDGWNCATPLEALTDDRNALLALAMNGKPLPVEHGFPVRMVVPGLYGFVSATKWLVDLEVTRFADVDAYWTQRGWDERGPVLTQSRVEAPRGEVKAGDIRIGGSAWAQHTGIAKVEYQVDGGPWLTARLGTATNDDTWVQWWAAANVGAGEHTVTVRATDRSGYLQTAVRAAPYPSGATGWHSRTFTAT